MKKKALTIKISPETGNVSATYFLPEDCICMIVLAHGAGADMHHSFMETLAAALAEKKIGTLRFNFPFMENKKGRPDKPEVAHATIAAAIGKACTLFPALPLFIAGKSFGGRMGSQYLALHKAPNVKGIIFYGFPLHPAGKPSTERATHLKDVQQPMLFLQGTKDTLATLHLIEEVCNDLKNATLIKLEGADHSFKAGKQDTMTMLVKETAEWLYKHL
ncbi:dienelactone hydrolase family protein [Panacibacter sp. DH6]|uniref:Dienelactone hydrolase family protein n=1 Tax=Panacibacter microcysteis TaxID=2793269 RepID=A0A931DY51_9BACT|nr:alpha/beta fold hydrolase [Panacibacter microcysteis]MBG9375067.1 dienelactone hydrolase family protein [Panacibacter microcysteis]